MTSKHFEMVASCVHMADFGPMDDWQTADRRLKHAQTLADNFILINPLFDRAKFIAVCMKGYGQCKQPAECAKLGICICD